MTTSSQITPAQINNCLPQTQCTQCGYQGCLPYAQAIAEGAPHNQCPPGGARVIEKLSKLLNRKILNLNPDNGIAQDPKTNPTLTAYIREEDCIGCTKCIQACPVDAIMGSGKLMHTVIPDLCTGCELCVAPCPVDCIDMRPADTQLPVLSDQDFYEKAQAAKSRLNARELRLKRREDQKKRKHALFKTQDINPQETLESKTNFIQEALKRAAELKNKPPL